MAEDDDLPSTRQWAAHHNTTNQTCNLVRRQHHYANNEQWLKPDLDQKSRRQYHQTPTSLGTPNIQSTPSHQSVPYCPPSFQFSYMHALNYHPSDSAYGHHNYQDTNKHYCIIIHQPTIIIHQPTIIYQHPPTQMYILRLHPHHSLNRPRPPNRPDLHWISQYVPTWCI